MTRIFNTYYTNFRKLVKDLKQWDGDLSRVTINYHSTPAVFVATVDSLQPSADSWVNAEILIQTDGTLKLFNKIKKEWSK